MKFSLENCIVLGVSIVLRSSDQKKIDSCKLQILNFVNKKKIKIIDSNN